ncbi:MAG: acetyltransferase [Patescibacteria group bacterium]|jgi:sugar O-acyltransferase (sialic acid O-acetyltransferase NeuD family)
MLKNKKNIIIIGAGENGEVALNCLLQYKKEWKFIGFLDDTFSKNKEQKIIGKVNDYKKYKNSYFYIAIGDNSARRKVFESLKKANCFFINLIHPKAFIEKNVCLGESVFVGANVYVNIKCAIGDNTIINNGCIIEHHNTIGQHCHLAPGVITGGGVKINNNVFIGLNSVIRDHVEIKNNVSIGMGSVITKDISSGLLVHNNLRIKSKKYGQGN